MHGRSKIPTSAEMPVTSFNFPESQAARLNPFLARVTYTTLNNRMTGCLRMLPARFDENQHHFYNSRSIQAMPLQRNPEESTPPTLAMRSEAVSAFSERFGIGRYAEANFDATSAGEDYRRAYMAAYSTCIEMTIQSIAMAKMFGCNTLWHAVFQAHMLNAFTAENVRELITMQSLLFGAVYHHEVFNNVLAIAFDNFPQRDAMRAMIVTQKALPHIQQSVQSMAFPLDPSLRLLFQSPIPSATNVLRIPMYGEVELYADTNDPSVPTNVNPHFLHRTGVAKGQYAIMDVPAFMDPAEYRPDMRNIFVTDYRTGRVVEVLFVDAIKNAMADSGTNGDDDGGDTPSPAFKVLGECIALEYWNILQAEEESSTATATQQEHFLRNLLFCGKVLKVRQDKMRKTAGAEPTYGTNQGRDLVRDLGIATCLRKALYATDFETAQQITGNGGVDARVLLLRMGCDLPVEGVEEDEEGQTEDAKAERIESFERDIKRILLDALHQVFGVEYTHDERVRVAVRVYDEAIEALIALFDRVQVPTKYDPIPIKFRDGAQQAESGMRDVVETAGRERAQGSQKKRKGELYVNQRVRETSTSSSASTSSMDQGNVLAKLVATLNERDDSIDTSIWEQLFAVTMTKENLASLHAYGVCLPLQLYMMRPQLRFKTSSYILGVPGGLAGYTWIVGQSYAEGMNAKNQTIASSFNIEIGVIIQRPECIGVLSDMEVNRMESGHGLKCAPSPQAYIPEDHDIYFFVTGLGDQMTDHFAVPANGLYSSSNHMTLIGRDQACTDQHFVSHVTQAMYGCDAGGRRDLDNIEHHTRSTIMQEAQKSNDFMRILEGTDDTDNFFGKWENSLQHVCLQMHQRQPKLRREIKGTSALGPTEDPKKKFTEYSGTFIRDREPLSVRAITPGDSFY